MADYKCTRCKVDMNSKCPGQRSVFVDLDHRVEGLGMLNMAISISTFKKVEGYQGDIREATIGTIYDAEERPGLSALIPMVRLLRDSSQEAIDKFLCNHNWELQNETCDLGCCKREGTKSKSDS